MLRTNRDSELKDINKKIAVAASKKSKILRIIESSASIFIKKDMFFRN